MYVCNLHTVLWKNRILATVPNRIETMQIFNLIINITHNGVLSIATSLTPQHLCICLFHTSFISPLLMSLTIFFSHFQSLISTSSPHSTQKMPLRSQRLPFYSVLEPRHCSLYKRFYSLYFYPHFKTSVLSLSTLPKVRTRMYGHTQSGSPTLFLIS